jgi:rod shape-determining protein MreC
LRNQLLQRKSADAELEQLKSVLDLAGRAGYKVLAARVISQGASTSFTQTITIDVGTSSGVRQNMTVVSGEGLVGVVKESYLNSALIMLATDPDFKVGVRVAGTQQIGILSGRGSKRAELQLLDNQKIVKVGDVLLARGSTNNRPFVPGIPVGIISAVDSTAGSIAQTATVMLYPNFSALGVVSVVLSAGKNNPGDALVPAAPQPTPVPTVTIFATPTPTATTK